MTLHHNKRVLPGDHIRHHLIQAALQGKVFMLPDRDMDTAMPDCPGVKKVFFLDLASGAQIEYHGVFAKNYVELGVPDPDNPGKQIRQQLDRPGYQWSWAEVYWPNQLEGNSREVYIANRELAERAVAARELVPGQLCERCANQKDCLLRGIILGAKVDEISQE